MAKKSLSGEVDSKLARVQEDRGEQPRLVQPRKAERKPKSFRLGVSDIDRLRGITERLSEETERPLTETDIIRGLLVLGNKTDSKKLISALKDAIL